MPNLDELEDELEEEEDDFDPEVQRCTETTESCCRVAATWRGSYWSSQGASCAQRRVHMRWFTLQLPAQSQRHASGPHRVNANLRAAPICKGMTDATIARAQKRNL